MLMWVVARQGDYSIWCVKETWALGLVAVTPFDRRLDHMDHIAPLVFHLHLISSSLILSDRDSSTDFEVIYGAEAATLSPRRSHRSCPESPSQRYGSVIQGTQLWS